jgi:predicted enzyme related to lactoylglutathione lyase
MFGRGGETFGAITVTPPGVEYSAWTYYFEAEDTDEAATRAQQQGATVVVEPMDIPGGGRIAVLSDPQGVGFAILTPA